MLDGAGNLYVNDSGNNRVRKIDVNGNISTVAGNGQFSSSGDDSPANRAGINFPSGMTFDASGNLYIGEFFGHRIRKVTPDGTISTFAGNGTKSFSGDNGPATLASLSAPAGLAFDAIGNLFISDSDNCRLRRVALNGIITTIAGTGFCRFDGDGGPALNASFVPFSAGL